MSRYLLAALMLLASTALWAQNSKLVQFSGIVLDGADRELVPIPYATVAILKTGRGTYTDWNGFFSIVAERGDVVTFSAIGYRSVQFTIPDTLKDSRYSMVQLMSADTINLPETVVFPWPSREHFAIEFLAMDVSSNLQTQADENTAERALRRMREQVPMDANENSDFYLRQQARTTYYIGQTAPMNIFNPMAWRDFFDAWKSGKFKKKKKGQ